MVHRVFLQEHTDVQGWISTNAEVPSERDPLGDPYSLAWQNTADCWLDDPIDFPAEIDGFTKEEIRARVLEVIQPTDPEIAKTGLWKERVAGLFSEKNFWEWPVRSNWEPEVRRAFNEWGFPPVSKQLQVRQWLGAWMLDTIWTELCSRIDSRRSRTKLITLPNPLFRCMFQVTKGQLATWRSVGPLWGIPQLQNEEKIGNIFECLATYYIMHKCWDGVRCIVRTAFEVQGGECMKCGDFTMVSKLRMYARDHKLLWVEQNLPKESTMAGELLRAAIPSLLYISQMTPNSRNGFIEYYRSRFQIEIPQVEVPHAGESRLENFLKTTEATTYGRGLTREEKLYLDVPWPIRPLDYYFAIEGTEDDEIQTMPRKELDKPMPDLPRAFRKDWKAAFRQLSESLIDRLNEDQEGRASDSPLDDQMEDANQGRAIHSLEMGQPEVEQARVRIPYPFSYKGSSWAARKFLYVEEVTARDVTTEIVHVRYCFKSPWEMREHYVWDFGEVAYREADQRRNLRAKPKDMRTYAQRLDDAAQHCHPRIPRMRRRSLKKWLSKGSWSARFIMKPRAGYYNRRYGQKIWKPRPWSPPARPDRIGVVLKRWNSEPAIRTFQEFDLEMEDPDPKALLYRGFITKQRVGSDWPTDPINPLKLEVTSQMHSMQKFSAVETYRLNVGVEEVEEPQQGPLIEEEFREESPRDESLQPADRENISQERKLRGCRREELLQSPHEMRLRPSLLVQTTQGPPWICQHHQRQLQHQPVHRD